MKRLFFALLLAIFAVTPVHAANFYWKSSTTDLNMITTPTAGDRGIVVTDAGAVSYWIYNGSAWVQAYGVASNLTGTPAQVECPCVLPCVKQSGRASKIQENDTRE